MCDVFRFDRAAVLLSAMAVALVACASTTDDHGGRRTPSSPRATPAASLATVCQGDTVQRTVEDFLQAYNAGAPDIVDRFIAPTVRFKWYGDPVRGFPESMDRGSLGAYLHQRHTLGEQLTLGRIRFNGRRKWWLREFRVHPGEIGWVEELRQVDGKGAVDCISGKIAVWWIDSWSGGRVATSISG